MRFSVVGTEKDAVAGAALIHDLRQNAFEVDDEFHAIRSLDELPGISGTSKSPTRALLLISNRDEVLFGSALKLDEALARRDGMGALVQGVLLDGAHRPAEPVARVAEWRGAVPVSQLIRRLAHDQAMAERVETAAPGDDDRRPMMSAWSRLIRGGLLLAVALVGLLSDRTTPRSTWAAILGAFVVMFASDVLEVRWKVAGNYRPTSLRCLVIGIVLVAVGFTLMFASHWKMNAACIGGLWSAACGDLILTLGSRRSDVRSERGVQGDGRREDK